MAKKNIFDIFAINNQTVFIEALGTEVTFRPLTKKVSDAFNKRLLGDYNGKGDVTIDLQEANKINSEKVALCLVGEDTITVDEINAYGNGIDKAIAEIVKHIDGREDDDDDKDGEEDTTAGN